MSRYHFMISAKLATLSVLIITVFWNKGYDVTISVHNVTNKVLSNGSNYIVKLYCQSCDQSLVTVAFLWEKLS